MGTATLDNAEVEVLWAMTKAVELLRNYFYRKGVCVIDNAGPMSILWTKKVERLCSFFEFLILLLLGCYVTNSTVYSFTVIPALYVFKNCPAGLC